ncbi:MAG: hypothetical protein RQ798_03745 [Candidatus Caldarchaeales archaeon]|jgi:hypothetical protein|nr:hypothetical protein [Candidatus Caldarchaeales archaeon]MDT7915639.1 hypothetical protein [Candidatus Caldarchaeales archaeon]
MTVSAQEYSGSPAEIVEKEPILRLLLRGSSLTRRQLEALFLEAEDYVLGRRRTFEEKARLLGVSRGTYARILGQALRNVSQSLYTLLLLGYLGMLGERRFSWLMELGRALEDGEIEEALEMLAQLAKEASPRPRPPPLFP